MPVTAARLCYNPFFIDMSTTVRGFLNPEIVLFGVDDPGAVAKAKEFYSTITDAPFHEMSIVNAEPARANYNTFITTKINLVNNLMGVHHKLRGGRRRCLQPGGRRPRGWARTGASLASRAP